MATCFARGDIEDIYNLGFEEIKVASYDCSSYQMIRDDPFKKIYVSTGATFEKEVLKTNQILISNNVDYELMHRVTIYPTPLKLMNSRELYG